MRKICCFLVVVLLVFATKPNAQSFSVPGFSTNVIGSNWDMPIGAAFTSDGLKLFVWEKGGKVFVCNRIQATGLYNKQATPVIDLSSEVGNWGDHGLTGFALDPQFAANGLIYLLYVVDRRVLMNDNSIPADEGFAATIGRITRYKTIINASLELVTDLSTRVILLGETRQTGIPVLHDGHGMGSLVFAADGMLLASAGDGASYTNTDAGNMTNVTYHTVALSNGIIRDAENVGAFRAQLINSHNGKILRMDPTNGNGVGSNPFFSAAEPRAPKSRVWALGLRNPFRFTIKPGTGSTNPSAGDIGELYVGDVGWNIYDEINIIKEKGVNCGWPIFEGLNYQTDYLIPNTPNKDEPNPLWGTSGCTGLSKQYFLFEELLKQATADNSEVVYNPCNPSMPIVSGNSNRFFHRRPLIDWKHGANVARVGIFSGNNAAEALIGTPASNVVGSPFRGVCSIGGLWYTGTLFPVNFRNTYIQADMGDFNQGWLKSFTINYTDVLQKVESIASGFAAIVCIVENPLDGTLVYTDIGTGSVKRITYGGNQYPVVNMTSSSNYGPSDLNVSFTGSTSFDPEGGRLTYLWNFGDGSPTSPLADVSHSFTAAPGNAKKYTVTLTIKDSVNFTSTDSIIISVNNTPPVVSITSPVDNSTYRLGADTSYSFSAVVTDAEHGPGALKYEWQKSLRHNNHEHPGAVDTTRNTSGIIARIGCNSETYYWFIKLKVTDAAGLFTLDSSRIYPACSPGSLPLVLRKFSVAEQGNANRVSWTTEVAMQIENFEIERSTDGRNFQAIGRQQARNTAGINDYVFMDNNFQSGVNYYRLKMIEIGNVIRYSAIVKIGGELKGETLAIAPNPVVGNFSVRYNAPNSGNVIIRIRDIQGRLFNTLNESVSKGQNIIYIQNMDMWKTGVLLISVEQGSDIQFGKIIKAQ